MPGYARRTSARPDPGGCSPRDRGLPPNRPLCNVCQLAAAARRGKRGPCARNSPAPAAGRDWPRPGSGRGCPGSTDRRAGASQAAAQPLQLAAVVDTVEAFQGQVQVEGRATRRVELPAGRGGRAPLPSSSSPGQSARVAASGLPVRKNTSASLAESARGVFASRCSWMPAASPAPLLSRPFRLVRSRVVRAASKVRPTA